MANIKNGDNKFSEVVKVRLSPSEKEKLSKFAEDSGKSLSRFIASIVDCAPSRPTDSQDGSNCTCNVYLPSETIEAVETACKVTGETIGEYIYRAVIVQQARDQLQLRLEGKITTDTSKLNYVPFVSVFCNGKWERVPDMGHPEAGEG